MAPRVEQENSRSHCVGQDKHRDERESHAPIRSTQLRIQCSRDQLVYRRLMLEEDGSWEEGENG